MTGPARAGVFVYAIDVERVARFYAGVLGLARRHARDDLVVLDGPDLQLVVNAMPAEHAAGIAIASPPRPRHGALRFFFTVDTLDAAATRARAHGGAVLDGRWPGPGFVAAQAMDPEGNVFQLREFRD